jgi:hypothetical protein
MDLVQLIEASRVLEIMGLLLALAALIFVLFSMYLVGRELVKYMPDWVAARSSRTNASLISRPNTWTEILKRREYLGIADWFIARFTLIGVLGVLAVGCAAWLQQKNFAFGMRVLALSILFGGACLVGGWLFGLLFGVPRTVTQLDAGNSPPPPPPLPPAPAPGSASAPAGGQAAGTAGAGAASAASAAAQAANHERRRQSGVNTNLTDISDWLTKTIVGVGLTQLYQAPGFIWSFAGKVNTVGFQWPGHGQLLALVLFVYFAVGGFWLGYVATRTVLTALLNQFDSSDQEPSVTALSLNELTLTYSGSIEPAPAGSLLAAADAAHLARPRASLTNPVEIAAWGAAQARAGNLPAAHEALQTAHEMAPADPVYRALLAKVLSAMGDRRASQQLGPDPWLEVLNALYDPAPVGFAKAIEKGETLARDREGGTGSASLHLWLASAYGQKYAFEKARNASEEILAPIKAKALAEARSAIEIDVAVLPTLRGLWNPAPGAEDDDLAVFKDDPDFRTLLGGSL